MLERLAHYNILGRIGAGRMGDLYRARDTRHGRTVALRVVAPAIRDHEQRRRQFESDAARAAVLSHPNIAGLYECGEDQGELYAASEFVPGERLSAVVAAGPLNPRRALQLAMQLADALADGHAHGLTHGALTADHVIVTPKGAAKVIDFGLTAWTAADGTEQSTVASSDIAALGLLLGQMLRGASPSRPRAVPPEIDAILHRAAALPSPTYDSAAMLAADLRAADATIGARSETSTTSEIPFERIARPRSPFARVAALVVVAMAVVGAGWLARDRMSSAWRRTVMSSPRPMVAVVPFIRDDGPPDDFSTGFVEDLAARLGQIPGVQVVARADAAVILAGRIRRVDDTVHVAVALSDAGSSDSRWQDDYDRDLKEVFPLQLQIATDVARAIGVAVAPSAAAERDAARMVDLEAYDTYLRGRAAARGGQTEQAAADFRKAVAADDGLAEAHAALALALDRPAGGDPSVADTTRPLVKRAAARAFELAPDLPAANLAMAVASDSFSEALASFKNAIRYAPSYADAYREMAAALREVDPERAQRLLQKSVSLKPGATDVPPVGQRLTAACEALIQADHTSREKSGRAVRQQLTASITRGTRSDAGPYTLRCAALCAAALGQAAAAATLLERIASSEAAVRVWTRNATEAVSLRQTTPRAFPWSQISEDASFAKGRDALQEAYRRARSQVDAALRDFTF
jgi:serine/threonine-protein kinase